MAVDGRKVHGFVQEHTLIRKLFINNRDRISMSEWNAFMSAELRASEIDLKVIFPHIEREGFVDREKFNHLLKWFDPLESQGKYREDESGGVHTVSSIAKLFRESWFHGFISTEESEQLLAAEPVGTFLIRFSGNPPNYALALRARLGSEHLPKDEGLVEHWRIYRDNDRGGFLMFQKRYKNLQSIITEHQATLLKEASSYLVAACPKPPHPLDYQFPNSARYDGFQLKKITFHNFFGPMYVAKSHGNSFFALEIPNKRRRYWIDRDAILSLQHPKLLTCFDFYLSPEDILYAIYEYADYPLYGALDAPDTLLTVINRLFLVKDIADGMAFLSQQPAIHMKIHGLLNCHFICISKNPTTDLFEAKIGMYGLHRLAFTNSETDFMWEFPREWRRWSAPENFSEHPNRFFPKCDIWSFGLILYGILEKKEAFSGLSDDQVKEAVKSRDGLLSRLKRTGQAWSYEDIPMIPLLLRCISLEHNSRPSFIDIAKDLEPLNQLRGSAKPLKPIQPAQSGLRNSAQGPADHYNAENLNPYTTELTPDPAEIHEVLEWLRQHRLARYADNLEFRDKLRNSGLDGPEDLFYLEPKDFIPVFSQEEGSTFTRVLREEFYKPLADQQKDGVKKWLELEHLDALIPPLIDEDVVSSLEHILALTESDLQDVGVTDPNLIKELFEKRNVLKSVVTKK